MDQIPTDLEIIEDIYYRYYDEYKKYAKDEPDRIARIRVPVNIQEIADACGVDEDMIFGRLYYHFNKKYSYKNEDGDITTFFMSEKFEGLSVNYPLVSAVLADLSSEKKRTTLFITISAVAVMLSVVAVVLALVL
ncbi:MAG: hypothetical protein JJ953_12250 [Gracilimonas sp.]|uniref:hypothetical protein n=1 Tax=Gracilimonas TaxID=649462 RepID=UPI001B02FCDE|nr:hypothetical protein [Gracilimonas sp.]MBO6586870.1 hypothetical protein [Gracilimonas sp.]MBO6614642.1 hypothetical protein [Gracilimonas sp.]